MNLYEAQEFFNNLYKGKEIKYEFDNMCMRQIEIVHSEALPHVVNHVEYQKVKVTVEGQDPIYLPIAPHRMGITWADIKKYIGECKDVYIHPTVKEAFESASEEEKINMINELMNHSGLSNEEVSKKL